MATRPGPSGYILFASLSGRCRRQRPNGQLEAEDTLKHPMDAVSYDLNEYGFQTELRVRLSETARWDRLLWKLRGLL